MPRFHWCAASFLVRNKSCSTGSKAGSIKPCCLNNGMMRALVRRSGGIPLNDRASNAADSTVIQASMIADRGELAIESWAGFAADAFSADNEPAISAASFDSTNGRLGLYRFEFGCGLCV